MQGARFFLLSFRTNLSDKQEREVRSIKVKKGWWTRDRHMEQLVLNPTLARMHKARTVYGVSFFVKTEQTKIIAS